MIMLELAICGFRGLNWVALTDGHTKYVRHLGEGREQLFNLDIDPSERFDLASSDGSSTLRWRARLASEFEREKRGAKWVAPNGSLTLAHECADYEMLEIAPLSSFTGPERASASERSSPAAKDSPPRPNIVFFLSDDQDLMLGGASAHPMRESQRLLVDQGSVSSNFFAHTPICGPSRAQILTGRYLHNLKIDPTVPKPRPKDENCMHVNMSLVQNHTFAPHLRDAGYTVGLFGKYLNWPADWHHVPAGFDAWFANGGGDYLSPRFVAKNLSSLGYPDGTWQGTSSDYSTSVIGNVSTAWIESVASGPRPFFAYIGVKAAHEPFTPAPWYADHWDDAWPMHEPRTPNWNCSHASRRQHHGCIATAPLLTTAAASVITGAFKNRWRTLLSFDDLVLATLKACEQANVVDRTYFISTSDHGYQLGQFNIPMDKRHVYDWDTRVPFVIRGPGIKAGSRFEEPATLVDLAPTFLAIAGLSKPAVMDGRSVLPLLVDATNETAWTELLPATRYHLERVETGVAAKSKWRDAVLLAHYFFTENTKCVENCTACSAECRSMDANCGDTLRGRQCWATQDATWAQDPSGCTQECYPTETRDNNYVALRLTPRVLGGGEDTLYAEFQRGMIDEAPIDFSQPNHVEYFDAAADPWMMENLHADPARAGEAAVLHGKLWRYYGCKGDACP